MYVTIICDLNSDNTKKLLDSLLLQYGFIQLQRGVYEINSISENNVSRLKLEIDRLCDSYDQIRVIQYPVEHGLVISNLREKRWQKKIINDKSIKKG